MPPPEAMEEVVVDDESEAMDGIDGADGGTNKAKRHRSPRSSGGEPRTLVLKKPRPESNNSAAASAASLSPTASGSGMQASPGSGQGNRWASTTDPARWKNDGNDGAVQDELLTEEETDKPKEANKDAGDDGTGMEEDPSKKKG